MIVFMFLCHKSNKMFFLSCYYIKITCYTLFLCSLNKESNKVCNCHAVAQLINMQNFSHAQLMSSGKHNIDTLYKLFLSYSL